MNLRILIDRIAGAIAACFIEEGLFFSSIVLIFNPHDSRVIVPMAIQLFLAGWLFFDKQSAIILAVIFKAYVFGLILKHLLSPLPHFPQPILDHSKYFVLWLFVILEGTQLGALLWLLRLKKQIGQETY